MAIKVMVVEDSNFMRKSIAALLSSHPRIGPVSLAGNGEEAIENLADVEPDVITLDFEMPGMDGLATLNKIMTTRPTPVIMFNAHTKRGANVTVKALKMGAVDFIHKPSGAISLDLVRVKDELIEKVIAAASTRSSLKKRSYKKESSKSIREMGKMPHPERSILFMASSTGGVQALSTVIPKIPASFPMPVLVVQHMPPLFTGSLASSLNENSALLVKEAEDGDILKAGVVFIAPGGWHSIVNRTSKGAKIKLDKKPSNTILRPCADITMNSIASAYEGNSIGVILTGMGNDGTAGAAAIRNRGGVIIAQDEATSTIFGMPRSVIEAGAADAVVSLDRVADQIVLLI